MKYHLVLAVTITVIQAATSLTNIPSSSVRNYYPTQYQGNLADLETLRTGDYQGNQYGGQREDRFLNRDFVDRDSFQRGIGYRQNHQGIGQGSVYSSPQIYQASRYSSPQSYQSSRYSSPQIYQDTRYSSPRVTFTSPLAGTRSFNAPLRGTGIRQTLNRFY